MNYILFLIYFAISSPTVLHDIHLSNCEIEFKQEESTVQISLRVFIDDLEAAIVQRGSDPLYLCTKKEHTDATSFIEEYIQDMFKIHVDGTHAVHTFVGKEISDDLAALWCYLEIENVSINETLSIENQMLMDLYDDQRNLTKVKLAKNNKHHFLFDPSDFIGNIDIK